jgi:hypothetical protein
MKRRMILITASLLMFGCGAENPPVVAQPEPAIRPIFEDSFGDVRSEWQQTAGVWEVADGWLVQRTDDARQLNAIKYVLTPRIADATIETEVRIRPYRPAQWTDSPEDRDLARNIRYISGAGIIFRMKNPSNYYMFRLAGEEGAVLGKMVDGEWTDLQNPRVRDFLRGDRIGFRRDNVYRLRVECYGSSIKCFINDEPVCTSNDGQFDLGQFGLVTFKTAADFDFIRVTK